MTQELPESLTKNSETRKEDSRTRTADLIDALTWAEEITPASSGPEIQKAARQIVKVCDGVDVAHIRDLAEKMRDAPNRADMRTLAACIAETVRGMLADREAVETAA